MSDMHITAFLRSKILLEQKFMNDYSESSSKTKL